MIHDRLQRFVDAPLFQNTIIVLIVLNALILGLETAPSIRESAFGNGLAVVDNIILAVFVVEVLLRIIVEKARFFVRPWNLFDFCIIAIALMPASEAFAALRALRVLRVLRLVSAVPTMRRVIEGLLAAIPGIAAVSVIMVLIFYVFAVIGTHLYGQTFPAWFGTIGETMFTLFQIMTLESWSMGIVRPVMEQHPNAWAFFVIYILVSTFTMLNLFIAIVVNAMDSGVSETAQESREEIRHDVEHAIQAVKDAEARLLTELRQQAGRPASPPASQDRQAKEG